MKKPAFYMIAIIVAISCGTDGNTDSNSIDTMIGQGYFKRVAERIMNHPDEVVTEKQFLATASVFSERTDFENSVPLLELMVEKYPESIPGRRLLANNYREQGKYNEALPIYNTLVDIDSVKFIMLPDRARLYVQLQEFDKAKADVLEAKKLEPNYFAVYLADGLLQYSQGDMVQAKAVSVKLN